MQSFASTRARWVALFLVFGGLVACGSASSDASPAPASDGGTPDGAPALSDAAGTDAAAACNTLDQRATGAQVTFAKAAEPKPAGGALTAGTFLLDEVTRYGMPADSIQPDSPDRMTMKFDGTFAEFVVTRVSGAQSTDVHSTSKVTVAGVNLTATDTCPTNATNLFQYTVTSDGFLLFGTFQGSRVVQHFVRVP
jgi:hypothetical protein